jgi:hypothetical protein
MDDLQCFVRGFHTKHVADVQKLAEVGDKNGGDQMSEIIVAFWRVSVELSKPSALRTKLMHFPFENWIQDAKVF